MSLPPVQTAEELLAEALAPSGQSAPEVVQLGSRAVPQETFFAGGLSASDAASLGQSSVATGYHTMIAPDGRLVRVPETQLAAAQAADYVLASPKQAADFGSEVEHHRVYGGWAGQTLTATTSGLAGLSMGLADFAPLVPTDDRRELEAENPTLAAASRFAGEALPIVLSGGAGAAAKGAQVGAGRALGQLAVGHSGQALEAVVKAALPQATSTLGKAATKGLSMAVGAAAEGAEFAAGHVVSEYALGNPNLTAESALSEIGMGALLGAGLGAVAGSGVEVLKPALSKARSAFGKAADAAEGLGIKLSSKVSGVDEATLRDVVGEAKLELRDPKAREALAEKFATALEDTREGIEKAGAEFAGGLRSKDLARHLDNVDADLARSEALRLSEVIEKRVAEFKTNPVKWDSARVAELEDAAMSLWIGRRETATAHEIFQAINDVKGSLWSLQRYTGAPGANFAAEKTAHAIGDLWRAAKDSLENEGVWGSAGKRLSEMNEAFSAYRSDLEEFGKEFGRTARTATGKKTFDIDAKRINSFLTQAADARGAQRMAALTSWLESGSKYVDMVEQSAKATGVSEIDHAALKKIIDATGEHVAEARRKAAITAMLNPPRASYGTGGLPGGGNASGIGAMAEIAGGHLLGGPALAAVGAAHAAYKTLSDAPAMARMLARFESMRTSTGKAVERAANLIARASDEAFHVARGELAPGIGARLVRTTEPAWASREIDRVRTLAADPVALDAQLDKQTDGWGDELPQTAAAVKDKITRDALWLASKMPKARRAGMMGGEIQPSPGELAKAARYLAAYNNPLREIRNAANGTLTPEARETLRVCYPEIYAKACAAVIERLTAIRNPSYNARKAAADLLGRDIDGWRSPQMLASHQAAFAAPDRGQREQAQAASNTAKAHPSASKITLANRTATESQQAQRRQGDGS